MLRSQRASHRSARYTAKLSCQVVRERDFRLVADQILDLSPQGALVGPADPVLTGERVIVSFRALGGRYVDAEALVARVIHGRRRGEYTRCLGLHFETLDAPSLRALHELLASAIPAPPGARSERRAHCRALGLSSAWAANALYGFGDDFAIDQSAARFQVFHRDAGGLPVVAGGA
jgi:hypothetical protein